MSAAVHARYAADLLYHGTLLTKFLGHDSCNTSSTIAPNATWSCLRRVMDVLLQELATYLAFQGNSCCAILDILQHVHASGPFSVLSELPESIKDTLWGRIIGDTAGFILCCKDRHSGITDDTACHLGTTIASEEVSDAPAGSYQGPVRPLIEVRNARDTSRLRASSKSEAGRPVTPQKVYVVTEQARAGLTRCDAEFRCVCVGLRKCLRLVAFGIRSDCMDRGTGMVANFTLVRQFMSQLLSYSGSLHVFPVKPSSTK